MVAVWIIARLPIIREGLKVLLDAPDLAATTVAAEALDSLVDSWSGRPPEVILLDVDVLDLEGWQVLQELTTAIPRAAVILVAEHPDDRRVARALALGASGLLPREASADEMRAAVRAAAHGLTVLHSAALARLREAWSQAETGSESDTQAGSQVPLIEPLSSREIEVLTLLTRGLANKQIAAQLYITEHTVKFHIRSILGKMGAANRTEAVMLAIQKGIVSI